MKKIVTRIVEGAGNWNARHESNGTIIIEMDRGASVYIQRGIARVYVHGRFMLDTEVGYMNPSELNGWLHDVERELN